MNTTTLYMPIESPPTPAPSPGPPPEPPNTTTTYFRTLTPPARLVYLSNIIAECSPSELLFISSAIAPRLKRDFLKELPPEIALHILEYVDEPRTLGRIACVSKPWRHLLQDEHVWKQLCEKFGYGGEGYAGRQMALVDPSDEPLEELEKFANIPLDPALEWLTARKRQALQKSLGSSVVCPPFSYRQYFKYSYTTMRNYMFGGTLLRTHLLPPSQPANEAPREDAMPASAGTVTSAAMDSDWLVVGLANTKIHVFSARTGVLARTLVGHDLGVWAVSLVSRGGGDDRPDGIWVDDEDAEVDNADDSIPRRFRTALGLDQRKRRYVRLDGIGKKTDPCGASDGWGQPNALVVSSGCDKVVRVWDVKTGHCIHTLLGHSSTIRCIRVFHNRPIAVTGSRDATLRVWDIQRGRMLRVLTGHSSSVRCLDVCSNTVVSGSYDNTCRVWDVDTGHCVHILEGHYHQIYSVAFDGYRIASGGLDTTVRIWDPKTGKCLALLQSHTALVCQLQLSSNMLCTGGSDGRVITFSLPPLNPDPDAPPSTQPYGILHRLAAHDSSVTALQFNSRFLLTAGNDGRVRLHHTDSGMPVRELGGESESVWKVVCRWEDGICAVMAKRAGRSVLEVWSFKGE